MSEVRLYTTQPGGSQQTVLVAFYERYREEKGTTDIPEMEAIRFGEYLLAHLEQFQTELKDYGTDPPPPASVV